MSLRDKLIEACRERDGHAEMTREQCAGVMLDWGGTTARALEEAERMAEYYIEVLALVRGVVNEEGQAHE